MKYFVNNLKNKIAAENFYNEVIKEIEKRSENPESYEKYMSTRKRKNTYYRIYVKNYTIFYILTNNTSERFAVYLIKRMGKLYTYYKNDYIMRDSYSMKYQELGKNSEYDLLDTLKEKKYGTFNE